MGRHVKGLHGDRMSRRAFVIATVVWLALWLICVIVGATGPSAIETVTTDKSFTCPAVGPCDVVWDGLLKDLSPFNQIVYVRASMDRPTLGGSGPGAGQPAMQDMGVRVRQNFQLSITVDTDDGPVTRLANSTHSAGFFCPPRSATCKPYTLFYESAVDYSTFRVRATWPDVLGWWQTQTNAPMQPAVTMHFSMTYVKHAYTAFENGFKAFWVTSSCLVFAAYFSLLYCKRCDVSQDPDKVVAGIFVKSSPNSSQKFLLALSWLLIWANDPTFALQITSPSFGLTAFYAVCLVTFVTALLLFFLLQIHLAALQAEGGLAWDIDVKGGSLGFCFWAPKLVLMTFFWTVALSSYLVSRYLQQDDPAFSLLESSPSIWRYFVGLLAVLVIFYFLHVFAVLVIAVRNWRKLRSASRIFIVFSISTFIIMVAGIFANVFSADLETSGAFLTVYGTMNLYIWFMCFFYMPDRRLTAEEIADAERRAGLEVDTTGVMAGRGGDGGGYYADEVVGEGEVTLNDVAGAAAEEGGEAVVVVDAKGRPLRVEYVYNDGGSRGGRGHTAAPAASYLPRPGEDEGFDVDFDAPAGQQYGGDEYGYAADPFAPPPQTAGAVVQARAYHLATSGEAATAAQPPEDQVYAIADEEESAVTAVTAAPPAGVDAAPAAAAPASTAVPPKLAAKKLLSSKASNPFADMA